MTIQSLPASDIMTVVAPDGVTHRDAAGVLRQSGPDELVEDHEYDAASGVWVPRGMPVSPTRTQTCLTGSTSHLPGGNDDPNGTRTIVQTDRPDGTIGDVVEFAGVIDQPTPVEDYVQRCTNSFFGQGWSSYVDDDEIGMSIYFRVLDPGWMRINWYHVHDLSDDAQNLRFGDYDLAAYAPGVWHRIEESRTGVGYQGQVQDQLRLYLQQGARVQFAYPQAELLEHLEAGCSGYIYPSSSPVTRSNVFVRVAPGDAVTLDQWTMDIEFQLAGAAREGASWVGFENHKRIAGGFGAEGGRKAQLYGGGNSGYTTTAIDAYGAIDRIGTALTWGGAGRVVINGGPVAGRDPYGTSPLLSGNSLNLMAHSHGSPHCGWVRRFRFTPRDALTDAQLSDRTSA